MSETLVSAWTAARKRLEAAGVDTPVLDARLLIEAGAGVSRIDIVTDPHRALSEAQARDIATLVARREAREPVSHILGRKAFWTLELAAGPAVLTPRPETEHVVAAALEHLPREAPARILDLGVGSGAILLALLAERPLASGVGLDRELGALAVAQANAEALGMGARAAFLHGGWDAAPGERFDVVVSNPPYIPSAEIDALAPEVARYEPRIALDGGADGLDAYRAILPLVPERLSEHGVFALEVGAGQAGQVADIARAAGLAPGQPRADLAGVERVVWGKSSRRQGPTGPH